MLASTLNTWEAEWRFGTPGFLKSGGWGGCLGVGGTDVWGGVVAGSCFISFCFFVRPLKKDFKIESLPSTFRICLRATDFFDANTRLSTQHPPIHLRIRNLQI